MVFTRVISISWLPMFLGIVTLLGLMPGPTLSLGRAEEPEEPARRWEFSVRPFAWFSSARTDFSIGGPGGMPNILSELQFSNLRSYQAGLSAEAVYRETVIIRISGQFGTVEDGQFLDNDYLGNNRTLLLSETISQVAGVSSWSVIGDVGWRLGMWAVVPAAPRSFFDLFVGWQHWEERYDADSTVRTQDPFGLFGVGPLAQQGLAITEQFTWDGLRVGVRGLLGLHRYVALEGEVNWIPWTRLQFTDTHWLRTDLAKDPSVEATAAGGGGFQFLAGIRIPVSTTWSVAAGYQMWSIESSDSNLRFYLSNGAAIDQPFNGAQSVRQGVYLDVTARF